MSGGELGIILAAVVAGSLAKSVTGMGLPIVVVPVASIFVDLADAVVVITLPNVVANAVLGAQELGHRGETRDLPVLALTGVAGAIVGTFVFVNAPEEPLIIVLVVAIVAYVSTFLLAPDLRTTPSTSRRWSPAIGTTAGLFQGAIGISGPIVGSWIHSYRLPRGAHILSVTTLFLITSATQLVVLVANGELDGRVQATLLACVPVLASIPLGTRLRNRVSRRGFDLAIMAVLSASAIVLCLRTFL